MLGTLSPFQGYFWGRNTTGGLRPRLWSVVSSRLSVSLYELLFVRNIVGKGQKKEGESISP